MGALTLAPGLLVATTPNAPNTPDAPTAPGLVRRPRLTAQAEALRPAIRPRSEWAGDLAVTGEILPEEDVRFLLVHHTASTNDYTEDQVVDQIRGFHQFHTGPERGWPDVAYNFFVDRFGGIWEGRQGSLDGPVRGDATGGSQGFAQLCSLIGNHQEAPVTAEQQASLVQLLAWLGETYAVDTTAGATISFLSRGSNRWPAGTEVTTGTISGHRDMSLTSCPGDLAYALIAEELPTAVSALRAQAAVTTTTGAPDTTATTAPTTVPPTAATGPTTTGPTTGPTGERAVAAVSGPGPDADGDEEERLSRILLLGGGAAGVAAAVAGVVGWVRRRRPAPRHRGAPDGRNPSDGDGWS